MAKGMRVTSKTFVPSESAISATRLLSPLMNEEMTMTVVTPMTMPRMVNPERSLLVLKVSRAILTDSLACPCAIMHLVISLQLSVLPSLVLNRFQKRKNHLSNFMRQFFCIRDQRRLTKLKYTGEFELCLQLKIRTPGDA